MSQEKWKTFSISIMMDLVTPRYQIFPSIIFALMLFFYFYTLSSYLNLQVYPLVHRITYYGELHVFVVTENFDHLILGSLLVVWLGLSLKSKLRYVSLGIGICLLAISLTTTNETLSTLIALGSVPAATSLIAFQRNSNRQILVTKDYKLTLNYAILLVIILGTLSIINTLFSLAWISDYKILSRDYLYDIFLVISSFSAIFMLVLISCFPAKILQLSLYRMFSRKIGNVGQDTIRAYSKINLTTRLTLLSLIVVFSIWIAIIPHLKTVNVDGQQVGVDTGYYVTWLGGLENTSKFQEFLNQAFIIQGNGDRPLSLIILYAIHILVNIPSNISSFLVIEYFPLALGPILAIVTYFLTRELTSNDLTSILAAFITAASYNVLIGIYAGFYANWIALIFGYLSFLFLFRYLKVGCSRNALLFGILMAMTLFSHVYTWSILSLVAAIFLAVIIVTRYRSSDKKTTRYATFLLIILLSTAGIDIVRSMLTGASGGIEDDLQLADRLTGFEQYALRWNNLTYTITTFVGGIFANFVVLILCIIWVFKSKPSEMTTIFLMTFFSIGLLPFLFGDWVVQTRVFYDIPFQIPAAIALTYSQRFTILRMALVVWLISVAITFASNFYYKAPV